MTTPFFTYEPVFSPAVYGSVLEEARHVAAKTLERLHTIQEHYPEDRVFEKFAEQTWPGEFEPLRVWQGDTPTS